MNILNISDVLPAPIEEKISQNDILLVTADKHCLHHSEVRHFFILIIPFVSLLTSLFSKRAKDYYELKKKEHYRYNNYEIQVLGIPMRGYRLSFLRPLINWMGYKLHKRRIASIIQKENIDIIHAHNVYNAAYLARQISSDLNIPYVITSRNIHTFHKNHFTKKNLLQASAVISINYIHKRFIDQIIDTKRSFILPHGVDDVFLNYSAQKAKEGGPIKIISICRLIELKNIDKVFMALDKTNLDFIYHIYGEGPERKKWETIKSNLKIKDKIVFKGKIEHDKVPDILNQYDFFVMPSFPETFGRVYFEAMSIGLPVIASKNTGIDGYIEDGTSGFLVDAKNIEELQSKILLLSNPVLMKSMAREAKSKASEFPWNKIIDKLNGIYCGVLVD